MSSSRNGCARCLRGALRRAVSLRRRDRLDAGPAPRRRPPARRRRRGRAPDRRTRPLGPDAGTTRRPRQPALLGAARPPAGAPLPQLSLVAGLAVAIALEREARCSALVKWPNDVLVDGRKVAGILLEASGAAVVCGIGINVNQARERAPAETRSPAVSLRIAAGGRSTAAAILAAVLGELEHRYAQWLDRRPRRARGRAGAAERAPRAPRPRRRRPRGRPERSRRTAGSRRARRGETVLVESGEVELSR